MKTTAQASPWIEQHVSLLAPGSEVLDLACGSGRHASLLLDQGHRVTMVDRDISQLMQLGQNPHATAIEADLEAGHWLLQDLCFDGVVVTNYLHRPLFPSLLACLRVGGMLLYETFAQGNERYGRPRNPDFLLRPGELKEVLGEGFEIIAFEDLELGQPNPAVIQHIAARKQMG